jgi:hypothetical protein
MPDLSAIGGLIREATDLEEFKNLCIAARAGDTAEASAAFLEKVAHLAQDLFNEFEHILSEDALGTWTDSVIHSCALINAEYPRRGNQTKKAVAGALPFTEMNETDFSNVNTKVGYYGFTDRSWYRSLPGLPKSFAECELKLIKRWTGRPWYVARAILAQAICSLCGEDETEVCLLLCEFGFVLLWRKAVLCDNGETVRQIFCYSNNGGWIKCVGDEQAAVDGRKQLFEILARISRVSSKKIDGEESIKYKSPKKTILKTQNKTDKIKTGLPAFQPIYVPQSESARIKSVQHSLKKMQLLDESTTDSDAEIAKNTIVYQDQMGKLIDWHSVDLSHISPEQEKLLYKAYREHCRADNRLTREENAAC